MSHHKHDFSDGGTINWNRFQENWPQLSGPVKERWKKISERQLEEIDGDRDKLVDALKKAYHLRHVEAEVQLNAFIEENEDYFELVRDSSASTPVSPRP